MREKCDRASEKGILGIDPKGKQVFGLRWKMSGPMVQSKLLMMKEKTNFCQVCLPDSHEIPLPMMQ